MTIIALIREGKIPTDNRVALTPAQCKWVQKQFQNVQIIVQQSPHRCFENNEYRRAGIDVKEDVSEADIFLGIKEVPITELVENKIYLFFSHTKKKQPYNQKLFQTIIEKKITLIDFECLEHEDGQRIIGFGFFAGVVGAHNGIWAYGMRTGAFELARVYKQKSFKDLIHTYFGLKIPAIKIAVTGSGRVAHGILEIMNLMGIHEVEPDEYLEREFTYPVYTQLKGAALYEHKEKNSYNRNDFHENPSAYKSNFLPYTKVTDILMNGIYWEQNIPRLFEKEDVKDPGFRIRVISDITDDEDGSVPINMGDQRIEDPVYGVDKMELTKTAPFMPKSIDIVAVGNLPNELPRDASKYFGEQLIKYVMEDLVKNGSPIIEKATIIKEGELTPHYSYLEDYAKK